MGADGKTIPPGIQGNPTYVMSGSDDVDWLEIEKVKFYTNAFIVQPGKVRCNSSQRLPPNAPSCRYSSARRKEDMAFTSTSASLPRMFLSPLTMVFLYRYNGFGVLPLKEQYVEIDVLAKLSRWEVGSWRDIFASCGART